MENIKWAPIFPLVGGFPLGAELATGVPPSYILSYDVAAYNDSFYDRYINETRKLNVPFIRIDANDFSTNKIPEIDIAVATPFCSGLSMLNTSASRGSDSEVNKWIYESTEFCMKYTNAKVIIGENAPGLYSDMGKKLRDNLINMASKYGYTMSFIKTSTIKHGIPQKRDRTFYFFWKSDYPPIFEWVEKKNDGYGDYMLKYSGDFDEIELAEKRKVVEDNVLYQFFKANGYGFRDIQKLHGRTLFSNLRDMPEFGTTKVERFEYYADWLISKGANPENVTKQKADRSIYESAYREAMHWINKYSEGKGAWDASLIFVDSNEHVNALISKSTNTLVHPHEERTLTQREKAYLMGMPLDFNVSDFPENVLNQNVPVNTAADMVNYAINFLRGNVNFADTSYIMQNNISKTIDTATIKNENVFTDAVKLF